MTEKPELLLCPFCGSPAEMRHDTAYVDVVYVGCTNDQCCIEVRDTRENAIRLWNTRVEK